jgi:hypothetical protein
MQGYTISHNYTGQTLGFIAAYDRHDAIVRFKKTRPEYALAALVAVTH